MATKPRILQIIPADQRGPLDEMLRDENVTYKQVVQAMRDRGWAVSLGMVRSYALGTKLRTSRQHATTKVERMLTPEHRAEYEALLKDPRTTDAQAAHWLRVRCYPDGPAHRREFRDTLKRVAESALLAAELMRLGHGETASTTMSGGMLVRCEQVLMEQFLRLDERGEIDPKVLGDMTRMVAGAVSARDTLESIGRENERAKRRAAEECQRLGDSGASGKDVVERMREILGV